MRFPATLLLAASLPFSVPPPVSPAPPASGPLTVQSATNEAEHTTPPLDSDAAAETEQVPEFFETTTVTARPISSATGSVTVIGAKELDASEARSGSEVLEEVAGVNLLPTGGRSGVTHAWIRGADPNFTLVLLDGIPINDPTDRQGGAVNLEEIPRGLVERAEVVRGPQTSFYGMSALSGVVQLFTPRGGPGRVRATVGAEAGNADLRRGFARVSGAKGRGGWSAGVSYDEEQFRIASERFRQIDTWASADLALGTDAVLALTARFASGEQDDYPNGSGGPALGTGELRHTDHDDLAFGTRLTLSSPSGPRHLVSAGLSRRAQNRLSPAIPPVVPESEEKTIHTRLRLAWQAPIHRSGRTQVDVGASGEGEWASNVSLLKLPPDFGGDVPGDYDEQRASGGVFGAFRQERGAFLYELALRLDGASGLGAHLNPQLGVVWRPGSGATRLRASAGRATKLPSFFALSSPPALGGNPDLEPERTIGGEVALEHRFPGAPLEVGVGYFLNEYQDLVDFDFDLFLHVNRARVRTQGVEITARWQPHTTLRIDAEVTWLDAEDLAGPPLLYEPRWLGGGSVSWQPSPALSLRLFTRAVSDYLDNQIPVAGRDSVPGYGLVGFAGSWRVHRGWSVRARIDNLADRGYETLIGFPGPGRAVWVGLGWDRL